MIFRTIYFKPAETIGLIHLQGLTLSSKIEFMESSKISGICPS